MTKQFIQSGLATLLFVLAWWPGAAQAQSRDSLRRVYDTRTIYGYGDKYIRTYAKGVT